jgi:lysophospholipase L1-like esterase
MRAAPLALLLALAGCSRNEASHAAPDAAPVTVATAPAPAASAAPAPSVASAPDAATDPTPPPFTARYKVVLHTGDSMVGGGLCRALKPRFAEEGTRFVRDVWESGSIEDFSKSDRIPKLIEKNHPDLVLLSLGANDVYGPVTDYLTKAVEKVSALTQKGGPRDCIWIGPPIWKSRFKVTVDAIREHAAPCVFFDSTDIEMHRKEDKIHPDEKGGEEWAAAFWTFFRGPSANGANDAGAPSTARAASAMGTASARLLPGANH